GKLHRQAFRLEAEKGPDAPPAAEKAPGVCALAISPDSTRIAVGFRGDPRVFVGDLKTRKWVTSFKGTGGVVAGACWSADGGWLFAGNAGDVGLGAWDVATGRRAWQAFPTIASAGEMMLASQDGSWLVYGGGLTPWVYLVKTRPGHPGDAPEFRIAPKVLRTSPVFAISPSGALVAAAVDARIYLWHTRQSRLLRLFEAEQGRIDCLGFSADSRKLIAGIGSRLVVFDLDIEREYQPLTFGIGDRLTAVGFDPVPPPLPPPLRRGRGLRGVPPPPL